jgi:hypothetical protein
LDLRRHIVRETQVVEGLPVDAGLRARRAQSLLVPSPEPLDVLRLKVRSVRGVG